MNKKGKQAKSSTGNAKASGQKSTPRSPTRKKASTKKSASSAD